MSTTPAESAPDVRPIDKFLAFGALGLAAVSILGFFATIIASAAGLDREDFQEGIWPALWVVIWSGLPLAFLLILTLLIMSFVRKGRAAKRS